MLSERGAIGGQPGAGVTGHIFRAAGDEGDAPMAVLDQMSHRGQDAPGVVGNNRRTIFSGANELHRVTGRSHPLEVMRTRGGMQGIDRDEALGIPWTDRHEVGFRGKEGPRRAQRIAGGCSRP